MVAWLGFACVSLVAGFHLWFDRRFWGTVLTPGPLLLVGYAVVGGIYAVARPFYVLAPVSATTYLAICALGLVSLLTSFLVGAMLRWQRNEAFRPLPMQSGVVRMSLILLIIVYSVAAITLSRANGGLWNSSAKEALNRGGLAHLHILLAFVTVVYGGGSSDRWFIRLPLSVVGLVAISLYPVKGWVLIPALGMLIMRAGWVGRNPRGWTLAMKLIPIGVLVFFGIYVARLDWQMMDVAALGNSVAAILRHFVLYSISGLIGLDAVINGLRFPEGPAPLFAPLFNLGAALLGEQYVTIISETFINVFQYYPGATNVYSFLGSLIAYTNIPIGSVLAGGIIGCGYVLFASAWRIGSYWARAGASYITALFAFGWFEYYLWHLVPWEVMVLSLLATLAGGIFRRSL